ncbi:hypothetical protein CK203_030686 [Vitis vinifera]|uniref:Uncharacterized protein n=1 Tax=Vitis vinifera TaxID=29760 RepID=A0A438IRH1_VITVI|nr:hypothetical protein CK203_030686 [Vitis vinifera]
MHRNDEEQLVLHGESKDVIEVELEASHPESPIRNGRPSSMVIKASIYRFR